MTPLKPDLLEVISEALSRYEQGERDYGRLDLSSDPRDFFNEAEAELLDCINYCVFQILRLRQMRAALKEAHACYNLSE